MKLFDWAAPFRSLYWTHRQRRLALHGWSDFPADELEGASVALVGSAGYLADLAQGPSIDSHDWVLRLDGFRHPDLESAVGSRTDVLLTDFSSPLRAYSADAAAAYVVATLPNDAALIHADPAGECHAERLTRGAERLGLTSVYVPEGDWLRGKRRQLGHVPGSEALAILFALEFLSPRCGPLYLTGFSLFQDCESDESDECPDTSSAERQLLRARFDWPLRMGSVRVDPVMSWQLRRSAAWRRAA